MRVSALRLFYFSFSVLFSFATCMRTAGISRLLVYVRLWAPLHHLLRQRGRRRAVRSSRRTRRRWYRASTAVACATLSAVLCLTVWYRYGAGLCQVPATALYVTLHWCTLRSVATALATSFSPPPLQPHQGPLFITVLCCVLYCAATCGLLYYFSLWRALHCKLPACGCPVCRRGGATRRDA
jgi:hypothetical protein